MPRLDQNRTAAGPLDLLILKSLAIEEMRGDARPCNPRRRDGRHHALSAGLRAARPRPRFQGKLNGKAAGAITSTAGRMVETRRR
jgi:hypothetical protein